MEFNQIEEGLAHLYNKHRLSRKRGRRELEVME
jgi:hypothetical protein